MITISELQICNLNKSAALQLPKNITFCIFLLIAVFAIQSIYVFEISQENLYSRFKNILNEYFVQMLIFSKITFFGL